LKVAKANVEKQSLPINLFIADIRNVCSREKFDLILNLFTSFGYFESDEENFRFIKRANGLLNNNGYFVLDYFNINYLQENLIPHSEKKIENKVITEDRFFDYGRVNKIITIKEGGKTKSFMESVKLYDKGSILDNFEKSGFKAEEIFGDYNGGDFDPNNSERLVIIFRK
jgi:SAM-dependent methyltransferase